LRPPGGTTFWHSTSAGKVIAAFQPDNIIEQYLAENTLKRCTPFTITDPEVLKAHLLAVRSRGWAIDRCENMQSTYCIAAPIYGGSESGIACISLASRTESMLEPPLFDEALTMLRNACSSISGLMGYF
jgi:DNA-binding IclR family transcriptional regulator